MNFNDKALKRLVSSLLIAALGLTALALADHYYRGDVRQTNTQALQRTEDNVRGGLARGIAAQITVAEDLQAFMLTPASLPDYETFDRFAGLLLDHYPQVFTVMYVGPDRVIRHIYPLDGSEAALDLDLTTRPAAPFVEKAIRERRLTVNNPTVTVQGSLAVIPRAPLYRGDEFLGLVQVVVEIDPLLQEVTRNLDESFQLQLRDATGALFWGPETLSGETKSATIPVGDNSWTLTVGWRNGPPAPDPFVLALLWGGGGALLLSLLFMVNRAWLRTEWLSRAVAARTAELETEIAQRRKAEERYKLISSVASDYMFYTRLDANGQLHLDWVAGAFEGITGYTVEEYIARGGWRASVHPDDLAMDDRDMEKLRANQRVVSEIRTFTKSGETRWVQVYAHPVLDPESGELIGIYGAVQDITERKQAEEALKATEKRFRTLVENSSDEVSIISADGVLLYESPTNNPTLGFPRGEFLGQNIFQLIHPDDLERVRDLFSQLTHDPSLQIRDQFRLRHRAGSWIWVEAVGTNLISEPSVGGIVVNYHDITSRKNAEVMVRQQLQRITILRKIDQAIAGSMDLRSVLEIVLQHGLDELRADAAVILLYDPEGQILEYELGMGMRTNALKFTRLKLGEGYAGRAAQSRQTLFVTNLQTRKTDFLRSPAFSQEGFACYFGVPLIAKGEIKGVLEIFHRTPLEPEQDWLDFMETLAGQTAIAIHNAQLFEGLQRANAELEQRVAERTAELNRLNIELQHANRAKDEFLANMSHELRTPLNSVLGLSESLLEQRRGALNEYQQNTLQIIESSGRHLLELINDILDLSKIEAGMFDYYPQIVDVAALCQSSLTFVKEQAVRKSIALTYEEDEAVTRIYADPRRLKQILVNLLTNAVKFTSENGRVALQVRADAEGDRVQFSVVDNGIGIAPDDLKRLFQPFVQVESALNRQYEGTGLGLALVSKLTDMHGGSVQVESEVGRGSRFTITIPWGRDLVAQQETLEAGGEHASSASSKSHPPSKPASDGSLVLLAEDNMANILTIGEYLENHGHRIVNAHDGLEAIQLAEETNPDIILMDIQMPTLDGLEAIRRLRTNPRFASTPIIALTALAMPGDRERCLEAGANEYLSKPVSLKHLDGIIRELTRHAK